MFYVVDESITRLRPLPPSFSSVVWNKYKTEGKDPRNHDSEAHTTADTLPSYYL
jgi:hypothetical protein